MTPIADDPGFDRDLLALLDHGLEGKLLADEEGIVRYANAAAEDLLGQRSGSLLGRDVFDLVVPDDAAARAALRDRVRDAPHATHLAAATVRAADGAARDLEARLGRRSEEEPLGGLLVSVADAPRRLRAQRGAGAHEVRFREVFDPSLDGIARDASERQRTERALQDHLTHLAAAEHAALVMVAHADFDGRWIKVPPALSTLLGYSARELLSMSLHDVTHPEDRAETARNLERIRDGAIATYAMEKRYVHRDGHALWVHISVSLARDADGRPHHTVAYMRDLTAERDTSARVARAYALLMKEVTRVAERVGLAETHTEIHRALLDLARTTTPADSLIVSLVEPRSGVRTCVFLAEIFDGRYVEADAGRLPPMPPSDSPQSRAVRERRAIISDDLLVDPIPSIDVGDDADDRPARSSLAMPLIVLGEVLGVFELQSTTPGAFDEAHVAQLQIAASLAAIAIKDLNLLESERGARERAEVESARLAEALKLAPTLTASFEGPEHVFVTANEKFARFFGGRPLLGRRVVDVIPEIEAQGILAILDRVRATGEPYFAHEIAMDLDAAGDGEVARHYFDLVYQPVRDGRSIHGVLSQAVDITKQVQARKDAERLTASLKAAYDETISGWARALDLKDEETAGHSQRVTDLTMALCHAMGVPDEDLVHVRRGALLHDIGKMGVPDRILLKPGSLDAEEWAVMKRHTQYARDFLEPIEHLRPAIDIPYCHHEKWDGSGYPRGLAGAEIPVAARIFAVVDVFDALTSERPYRAAWTRDEALAHIAAGRGAHFAPDVVDAFLALRATSRGAPEGR